MGIGWQEPVGIGIAVAASTISNLGLNLQKKALTKKASGKTPAAVYRSLWLVGFALIVGGALADFAALGFCPQAVVAPLGAWSLVANTVIAPCLLGEKLTRRDVYCVALITSGCVVAVTTASGEDPSHTASELFALFLAKPFAIYISLVAAMMLGLLLTVRHVERVYAAYGAASPLYVSWIPFHRFSHAFMAGVSGGQSVLLAKLVVELLKGSIIDHTRFFLATWEGWVALVCLAFTLTLQVYWMQCGLARFDALVVAPIFSASWILWSVMGGLIFYNEFALFTPVKAGIFPVGIVACIVGVYALSKRGNATPLAGTDGAAAAATPLLASGMEDASTALLAGEGAASLPGSPLLPAAAAGGEGAEGLPALRLGGGPLAHARSLPTSPAAAAAFTVGAPGPLDLEVAYAGAALGLSLRKTVIKITSANDARVTRLTPAWVVAAFNPALALAASSSSSGSIPPRLKSGDLLVRVNGESVLDHWITSTDAIRRIVHSSRPLRLTFRRFPNSHRRRQWLRRELARQKAGERPAYELIPPEAGVTSAGGALGAVGAAVPRTVRRLFSQPSLMTAVKGIKRIGSMLPTRGGKGGAAAPAAGSGGSNASGGAVGEAAAPAAPPPATRPKSSSFSSPSGRGSLRLGTGGDGYTALDAAIASATAGGSSSSSGGAGAGAARGAVLSGRRRARTGSYEGSGLLAPGSSDDNSALTGAWGLHALLAQTHAIGLHLDAGLTTSSLPQPLLTPPASPAMRPRSIPRSLPGGGIGFPVPADAPAAVALDVSMLSAASSSSTSGGFATAAASPEVAPGSAVITTAATTMLDVSLLDLPSPAVAVAVDDGGDDDSDGGDAQPDASTSSSSSSAALGEWEVEVFVGGGEAAAAAVSTYQSLTQAHPRLRYVALDPLTSMIHMSALIKPSVIDRPTRTRRASTGQSGGGGGGWQGARSISPSAPSPLLASGRPSMDGDAWAVSGGGGGAGEGYDDDGAALHTPNPLAKMLTSVLPSVNPLDAVLDGIEHLHNKVQERREKRRGSATGGPPQPDAVGRSVSTDSVSGAAGALAASGGSVATSPSGGVGKPPLGTKRPFGKLKTLLGGGGGGGGGSGANSGRGSGDEAPPTSARSAPSSAGASPLLAASAAAPALPLEAMDIPELAGAAQQQPEAPASSSNAAL